MLTCGAELGKLVTTAGARLLVTEELTEVLTAAGKVPIAGKLEKLVDNDSAEESPTVAQLSGCKVKS